MSNVENQPTGNGPKGWLEKGLSASLFIRCVSHLDMLLTLPCMQTLLEANDASYL